MEQIGILHQVGIRVVVVHGGGPQSTLLSKRLGLQTQMVEGRRVTDAQTLEVSTMVLNGEINTRDRRDVPRARHSCDRHQRRRRWLDQGKKRAAGAAASQARPSTTASSATSSGIDASIIVKQLDNDLVPIVSPLSADDHGVLLNINADTVAAAIACELKAEKFVLATGAPGILESLDDPRSLISYIDRARLTAAARRRQDLRRNAAEGGGDRAGARGRRAARARHLVLATGQPAARGIHERRHGHARRQ